MMRVTLMVALAILCSTDAASQENQEKKSETVKPKGRFPDFGHAPPPQEYSGPVFRLSQDYPSDPKVANQIPDFLGIDFQDKANWKTYILAVRDYCFEGNVHGGDVENDWRVGEQKDTRWFHMPWQHYGVTGREALHGLTKEAPVKPGQFFQGQDYEGGQTYAVGFFNEIAAYTIGQVWEDHDSPDARRANFQEGTTICKLLFTDVPIDQVPFLVNPLQWDAYITENFKSDKRSIRKVALIQMDIAVRDKRSPCGWVFGTFQYNGAKKEKDRWYNLVPVGLQWGNDPEIRETEPNPFPIKTRINPKLKETVINEDDELPPTHLGWNGRLNGPVDNPMSSCLSCHMTAQAPDQVAPLGPMFIKNPPAPGSDEWMRWFQNIKAGKRFIYDETRGTNSTDFSLQLSQALQSFYQWRSSGTRIHADNYVGHRKAQRRAEEKDRFKVEVNPGTGETVNQVRRNGPIED